MPRLFQPLKPLFWRETLDLCIQQTFRLLEISSHQVNISRCLFVEANPNSHPKQPQVLDFSRFDETPATNIHCFLKNYSNSSVDELEQVLDRCGLVLDEEIVVEVLGRCRSDWKLAYVFFNWVSRQRLSSSSSSSSSSWSPGSRVYNEILDILGRMKRFEQLDQVFDEMLKREGVVDERTFAVLMHRYASAHKLKGAIKMFYRRREFGLEVDSAAFQTLLLALCRYKHVEEAESLFHEKIEEFPPDIKTLNIILNGWCVLGNVREAKRFWKDVVSYRRCKPDIFTYGIFINALTKAGKLGSALKLFRGMWKKGFTLTPDVAICNCIIDALCFKKRIPEALDIFGKMNERGCSPNVVTYNSLIKHLCHIQRMEKVYKLLEEMEQMKGSCEPNSVTYNYLLKSMKKPKDVFELLERMETYGCKVTSDTYNLILKLFMYWNHADGIRSTWIEMEKNGVGPDQRSFTIMVHGLYKQGKKEEALWHFNEMKTKGIIPEPRTILLMKDIETTMKKRERERGNKCEVVVINCNS